MPVPPSVLPEAETRPDPGLRSRITRERATAPAGPARRPEPWRPSPGLVVASLLSLFVFGLLNWPDPDGWGDITRPLLFLDTTPSGGDMGAHVWGPAYLRDELLPSGRLTGWTPDWYAGFPAFHFYMVVPALAIIALNVGLPWYLGVPAAAIALYGARVLAGRRSSTGRWILAAGVLAAVLLIGMPYGVAFKLVSVSGLVFFPLSAWAMGRLAGAPSPVPAFLSMAAFIFLFDTNFTIYGGNVASTLAGEFAFSISLCLSLLAIGLVLRGLDDHRWRAPAAIVIALVALCHIIPVFFLVPALLLAVLATTDGPRSWVVAGMVAFALIPIAFADGTGLGIRAVAVVAAVIVMLSAMAAEPVVARRAGWLLLVGPVAILLTGFWLVPFYLREPYFNDMGWERLNDVGPAMLTVPIKIALPVAAVGFLTSLVNRERIGLIFTGTGLLGASAVANLGEGPLWNARLLPFYYLSVYVVAAVGLALVARYLAASVAEDLRRPDGRLIASAVVAGALATLIAVAMPLRIVPLGQLSASGDGSYRWLGFTNQARSLVPGWADWNYSGYEEKSAYREYHHVVTTMSGVGEDRGCGRAMWEYEKGLDRYGTPMALMLLPHWTEGCIGSMEGLYFESSATTPFHFLNQSVLSEAPSRAQRDLPYLGFDIDVGVAQLQVMGVRYYLAQSDVAIAAAREHPDLTEVTDAQPFVVFEVTGSELVAPLEAEPVVTGGRTAEEVAGPEGDAEAIARFEVGWVSQAVTFYNDPTSYASLPAEDGPEDWIRQATLGGGTGPAVEPAEVSDIAIDNDSISFSVDRTGVPVLVKVSYFPNWQVDGADGPWRIGPNLMAVVPTAEQVQLSYGRTLVDWGGQALTLFGLLALVGLGLVDRGRFSRSRTPGPDPVHAAVTEAGLAGLGLADEDGAERIGPPAPIGVDDRSPRPYRPDRRLVGEAGSAPREGNGAEHTGWFSAGQGAVAAPRSTTAEAGNGADAAKPSPTPDRSGAGEAIDASVGGEPPSALAAARAADKPDDGGGDLAEHGADGLADGIAEDASDAVAEEAAQPLDAVEGREAVERPDDPAPDGDPPDAGGPEPTGDDPDPPVTGRADPGPGRS